MSNLNTLIVNHAKLLKEYRYAYISSTALLLLLPWYKGTPRDFDIALDWQGKGKKELIVLYRYLKKQPWIANIKFKAITTQTIANQKVEKNQHIYLNCKLFSAFLTQGNLKLTYDYHKMPVELFPEQEGNGVTNIDIQNPTIHYLRRGKEKVAVLDILEVAKRYSINLIDEIAHRQFANIKNPNTKHKDALRLNTIIQILSLYQKDATPLWVLAFIRETIKDLKKSLPKQKRSQFIQEILDKYPKVYKKLSFIAKLYNKLTRQELDGTDDVDFSRFHENLKQELVKVYDIIDLYQTHILKNLYVKKSNFLKSVQQQECEKMQEYIQKINLSNKINGFAYFYEIYFIMDMIKHHQ